MDERTMQFRVGVLVLATVIICVVLIYLFSDRQSFLRGTYDVGVKMQTARGVAEGTPVRRRGVLIGRVTKVQLTEDYVLVTLNISNDVHPSSKEVATLQTSLLGDAEIEFAQPSSSATAPAAKQPVLNSQPASTFGP
jgi:phospholipid/cholesterol/gamma-HCH transport system substrate-binding protein